MSFDDFYRNFETLQLCELTPDSYSDELAQNKDDKNVAKLAWKLTSYNGEWQVIYTYIYCDNLANLTHLFIFNSYAKIRLNF